MKTLNALLLACAFSTMPIATATATAQTHPAWPDKPVRVVVPAFAKQGLIVGGGTPAEFKAFIDSEARQWGAIIKKVGISID